MFRLPYLYLLPTLVLFMSACKEEVLKTSSFSAPLFEPCMLVNYEQDNTIEGNYFTVESFSANDSSIRINLPTHFFINETNLKNWTIGWGSNVPLYDAGVENIREIKAIDTKRSIIYLGVLKRGSGFPVSKQRVVFWNKNPSGYTNSLGTPVITSTLWPEFGGKSMSFSSIAFDSIINKWVMLVTECDTSKMQVYAAISSNLIHWQEANHGNPILTPNDFKNCTWAGFDKTNTVAQAASPSDLVRFKNKWYLFLDGYDTDGKRHVGIAVSATSILGPYSVYKNPILSPGESGSWNETSVFYAKVKHYKNEFILFYDGVNSKEYESVGMARSTDLIHWEQNKNNPVLDQHTGWRSSEKCIEPNYIEINKDTILLMVAGTKKFKMGAWHHYITKRMYLDKSGNVGDAQLGVYFSTDSGNTFTPHKNNPVLVNDYSNNYENDHLGGNFKLIKTDTANFIFYQAKSSYQGLKYNIMLRICANKKR